MYREEYPRNLERALIDLENNKYPKQKEAILSDKKINGFFGGNRSAKTTTWVLRIVMECKGIHPLQEKGIRPKPPLDWRFCGESFKIITDVLIPEFLHWIPKEDLLRVDYRNLVIYWKNGSKIDFLSYEQEAYKFASAKKDGVGFDEQPYENQYNESIARLIDYGGIILLSLTPVKGMSWIYDRVWLPSQDEGSKIFSIKASIWDNPYISDDKKKEYLDQFEDDDEKRVREFGDFIEFAGLIWIEFDRKIHCVPRFELDFEKEIDGKKVVVKPTRYMAVDPMGRAIACLWVAVYPNGRTIVYDELWIENAGYEEIIKVIVEHDDGPIKRRWIDWNAWSPGAGGGTTLASELFKASKRLKYKVGFAPAQKGPGSVKKGNLIVSEYFKTKDVNGNPLLLIFDDLKMTKYQISHYVYGGSRRSEETHDPSPKPKDKDKHFPDCLRYILSTRPKYISEQGTIIRSPISGKIVQVKSQVTGWVRNIPKRSQ